METKKRLALIIISITILLAIINPLRTALAASDDGSRTLEEVNTYIPLGQSMVESAMEVLSNGLNGMSDVEREQFERIFDPSQTGTIDQDFVDEVLENFRKIESRLNGSLSLEYEEDSSMCEGMRLYYTDFIKIHVCPYINAESDIERNARVLVHEVAHMALLAGDRTYYHPKSYSASYNELTPRGSWASQLPVVGKIFREISRSDTLYHPDAYAWFASLMYSSNN